MAMLQRTDSIGANGVNSNVWTGTQFEFAPFDGSFEAGAMCSATGLQMTLATGQDTLTIDQALTVVRSANQYPIWPDDFVYTDVIGVGQRIIEFIRNTTAGALSHFSAVRLTPL